MNDGTDNVRLLFGTRLLAIDNHIVLKGAFSVVGLSDFVENQEHLL